MRLAVAVLLLVVACEDSREWKVRQAVRAVVDGESDHPRAMDFVAAQGRYAIPEIEQQIHKASDEARKRLISLLARIGDPAAIPLLRILAERGSDEVKKAAKEALVALKTS